MAHLNSVSPPLTFQDFRFVLPNLSGKGLTNAEIEELKGHEMILHQMKQDGLKTSCMHFRE